MTLRQAVRHIYRAYPLRRSARALLPWAILFVLLRVADLAETYAGLSSGRGEEAWGITAAAGLIKGVIGTLLVLGANKFAHRMGQEGVYN